MVQSASVVQEHHQCLENSLDIPSVCISYDGTWQKRGHSSHNVVGIAIDIDTCLVIDAHVHSNYCKLCDFTPKLESPNYIIWKANHLPVCQINHNGSSNRMEMKAAEVIFARSIESRQLIYRTMLCDSKALNKRNPCLWRNKSHHIIESSKSIVSIMWQEEC